MRLLYLDLNNSGISGDMFLASLLGLVPEEANKILEGLLELKNYLPGVSKLTVGLIKIPRSGIQLNQLKLEIKETKNHRSAKTLKDSMNKYLNEKNFTQLAKNYANQVLDKLIHAEADVHGKLIENIHLHELSSVDTLVDILGVTTALDQINGFEEDFKVFCSKLPLGGGRVKTAHGMLAVPAPATLKIIENSNLITYGGPIDSELVTPTGAALLTSLNPKFHQHLPELTIQKSSSSTGQKEFEDFLNEMRIYYGEYKGLETSEKINWMENYTQKVSVIETNVDDVSGEILGNFINNLRNENVLDI
ncbi:MAG: nickel pincer cofactor biosynthesis protein LarC, partial [Promethearchaeota archaeon]